MICHFDDHLINIQLPISPFQNLAEKINLPHENGSDKVGRLWLIVEHTCTSYHKAHTACRCHLSNKKTPP
jgi:hypothetical protein